VSLLKELRFHPHTDTHDFDFKTRHARRFLGEGHKVKATSCSRGGRSPTRKRGNAPEPTAGAAAGRRQGDQTAHMEGRSMIMILSRPRRKKVELKPEEATEKKD